MPYRNELRWAHQRISELENLYRREIRRADRLDERFIDTRKALWSLRAMDWIGWLVLILAFFALALTAHSYEEAMHARASARAARSEAITVCLPPIEDHKGLWMPGLNP